MFLCEFESVNEILAIRTSVHVFDINQLWTRMKLILGRNRSNTRRTYVDEVWREMLDHFAMNM